MKELGEIGLDVLKENPEKWLSPTINGGDLRHFSKTDFLKSNIAKSPTVLHAFISKDESWRFLLI